MEIDTLTGDFHVLKADVVHDVGKSLNPAIDIGQVSPLFQTLTPVYPWRHRLDPKSRPKRNPKPK